MMQVPPLPVRDTARAAADTIPWWTPFLDPQALSKDLIKVVFIIGISLVLYRIVRVIVRRIVAVKIDEEDPIVRRLREQRAQTLGSLFTNVAFVFFVTITLLTALNVFMPIGPLLASVSVVGLAISFGAQSLVKDIISGTFILIEGQFGIGDVVRIGDIGGLVEKMTLRTTVLRDDHGAVHIIPNGEIKLVSNLTKTWSRAVIEVNIAYGEDVERVMETLRAIGSDFERDPEWAPLLLEPPNVLGIERLTDTGVVLKMTAKTLPLKQWDVSRELRKRIKKRFETEQIEIPHSRVKMIMPEEEKR
jgi:moderate conductance mechanosensitive channel